MSAFHVGYCDFLLKRSILSLLEFAQDEDEVWQSIMHVDFVEHFPVSSDMLQSFIAVDTVCVPHDMTQLSTMVVVSKRR